MLGELLMDLRSELASQSPPTSLVNLQPRHQQSISNHVTIQSPLTSLVNLQPRHQQSISNHVTIQSPPTSLVNLQPRHQQSISNHVTIQSPPTSLVNLQPRHHQSISNHVTIQSPPTSLVNLQPRHHQSISNHVTIQSPPTSLVNLQPRHQQSIFNHVTSHYRSIFRIIKGKRANSYKGCRKHNEVIYIIYIYTLYSRLRLIESLGQEQNHNNSINSLRLIGPTPKFRLIGSKCSGTKVTRLSGVDCVYNRSEASGCNIYRISLNSSWGIINFEAKFSLKYFVNF